MKTSLYVDRDSWLTRRHPQVKLFLLVLAFLCAWLMESFLWVLPVVVLLFSLLAAAGALGNVRRLLPLFVIAPIASFLLWSVFYRTGEPLPVVGALGVTREAVRYGLGMAAKLESFFAVSILFLSITRVEEFTAALRGLGLPYRVSFVVALSFRLVPLFVDSALAVLAAQKARGLDLDSGTLGQRVRRFVPVVVPVFMGALRRADFMAMALEARGFGSSRERTSFPRMHFGAVDGLALAFLVGLAAFYLWAWSQGFGRIARGVAS